jgi:hypothetical protein
MSVEVSFESADFIVVRCQGTLEREAVDAAKRQVFAHMMEHGMAHLLIVLAPGFNNLQAFASWDDIEEDRFIQKHVIRLAIVGDLRWRDSAVLFLLGGLVPFQMEYFPSDQEDFAHAWLLA